MDAQDEDRTKISNANQELKEPSKPLQPNLAEMPKKDVTEAQNITQIQESINPSVQAPKSNLLIHGMQSKSQPEIKATEWRKRLLETQYASSKVKTRSKSLSPKTQSYTALHSRSSLLRRSASPTPATKTATSDSYLQTETTMSSNTDTDETRLGNAPLSSQFPTIRKVSLISDKKKDYQLSEDEKGRHNALPKESVHNTGTSPPYPEQEKQEEAFFVGSDTDMASSVVWWLKGVSYSKLQQNLH
ncbi:uncharacterized protein LOC130356682 [Hyla sarda]|uniref:uncharacterized protein LOC130356682 n=1 Tax=Hyla sarda TaxID=327740 RepID=UPI0024C35A9A|nr:uncharacterized protein LOC130356682 [Hyla sarda]